MKHLLALEEVAIFCVCVLAFAHTDWSWWWFPALLLVPDIGMIGYAFGPVSGAIVYNLFHHRATALCLGTFGFLLHAPPLQLAGIVALAHISMDRALGYGLKHTSSFRHTHLGSL